MANNAINVKSFLATVNQLFCNRYREFINIVRKACDKRVAGSVGRRRDRRVRIRIINFTGIESLVFVQLPAGNRALDLIS